MVSGIGLLLATVMVTALDHLGRVRSMRSASDTRRSSGNKPLRDLGGAGPQPGERPVEFRQ